MTDASKPNNGDSPSPNHEATKDSRVYTTSSRTPAWRRYMALLEEFKDEFGCLPGSIDPEAAHEFRRREWADANTPPQNSTTRGEAIDAREPSADDRANREQRPRSGSQHPPLPQPRVQEVGDCTISRPAPEYEADTWGPYFDAIFPPRRSTHWISWKISSSGMNIAKRLWNQREEMRRTYEAVHGSDPARWPTQHPGVVLDTVQWIAHAACRGCQWLDARGHDMRDRLPEAAENARRHQISRGKFRGHYMAAKRGIVHPAEAAAFDRTVAKDDR